MALGKFGVGIYLANFVSTSTALIFSYSANRKYTFRVKSQHNTRTIVLFMAVTGIGLWIIQPVVITLFTVLVADGQFPFGETCELITAKIVATIFSLAWNYTWYKKVVFKEK